MRNDPLIFGLASTIMYTAVAVHSCPRLQWLRIAEATCPVAKFIDALAIFRRWSVMWWMAMNHMTPYQFLVFWIIRYFCRHNGIDVVRMGAFMVIFD
jgi:hypothetical protein